MDYAYQHGFGHVWNDFDDKTYRDHVFAYPTLNGVIDTVQWEGFREGVDDVRYLTTLRALIEQGKADPAKQQVAAEAGKWLDAMDVERRSRRAPRKPGAVDPAPGRVSTRGSLEPHVIVPAQEKQQAHSEAVTFCSMALQSRAAMPRKSARRRKGRKRCQERMALPLDRQGLRAA